MTSCGEKFLSLLGRVYSGDEQICNRLLNGLLQGKMIRIRIVGSCISFVYEGVSFNFTNDSEKLSQIKVVLKNPNCNMRLEVCEDDNFSGFRMLLT
jgi:hypothetical protein